MPQEPKSFIPDDEQNKSTNTDSYVPGSFIPDENSEPDISKQSWYQHPVDTAIKVLQDHPKIKEIAERLLTGTSPEFEETKAKAGITSTLGTPESETSLLPHFRQPESYAGGFLNSLYEDFVRPMATPSGIIGNSNLEGIPSLRRAALHRDIEKAAEGTGQKLLTSGPRFSVDEGGNAADLTRPPNLGERPYRAPESFTTAEGDTPAADKAFQEYLTRKQAVPTETPNPDVLSYENEFEPWKGLKDIQSGLKRMGESFLGGERPETAGPIDWGPQASPVESISKESETKPTARYKYTWQDENGKSMPMYEVIGGPSHGSDKSIQGLKDLGIEVPETPVESGSAKEGIIARDAKIKSIQDAKKTNISKKNDESSFQKVNKPITGQMVRNKDYEKLWNNTDENSYSAALDRHIKSISQETDPEVIKDNYNNWNTEYEERQLHGTPDDIETAGTLRDEALDKLRQLNKQAKFNQSSFARTEKGEIGPHNDMSPDSINLLEKSKVFKESNLNKEIKSKFTNPFEKTVEAPKSFVAEEIKPVVEEPKATIKEPVTIKNAPPDQRAKMFRGAHEPVDILFTDSNSRDLFGAGQSGFSKGMMKAGWAQRMESAINRVINKFGVTEQEARKAIPEYNAHIRGLGKAVDREGGSITAPSFEEFLNKNKAPAIESPKVEEPNPAIVNKEVKKFGSPTLTEQEKFAQSLGGKNGIVELQGGIGGIKPPKTPRTPNKGPAGPAVDKLYEALESARGDTESRMADLRAERAKRFAAFEGVKKSGVEGAKQSLSKLKGEYESFEPSDALKLSKKDTDSLFTTIKRANITAPEKARGYTALFKLINGDETLQRNELKLLDDVFGGQFAEHIIELHGGFGLVGVKLGKTANTMKAAMSMADFSAPLRQGIGLIHRPEFRSAFKDMFKYFANPEYYKAAMTTIEQRPTYLLGRESGLFLAKPGNLLAGEETFMNNYIHDLPSGLKGLYIKDLEQASERAYTGFLNKLRADTFDSLIKQAKYTGNEAYTIAEHTAEDGTVSKHITPSDVTKNLAKYINVSTGRGGLGVLEKIAPELNTVIWSPRLISSRLSILNPQYYAQMDPFTRKEAIKSLLAITATGLTVGALGGLAGGKVSSDPLSADFGKVRFGNKVLDPWAGFQQPVVAATRFLTGKTDAGDQSRDVTAGRFAVNKLSPIAGLAYDLASAKKFTGGGNYNDRFGNRKSISTEVMNRFIPIFTQDMTSILKDDPTFAETIGLGVPSALGMGTQDYPERKPGIKLQSPRMDF